MSEEYSRTSKPCSWSQSKRSKRKEDDTMGEPRSNPRADDYRGPSDQQIGTELAPRVLPNAEWIARAKATEDKTAIQPPTDAEQDLVIFIRCNYMIPSALVPKKDWPVVGFDTEIELGRIPLVVIKQRVKEVLEKAGRAEASLVNVEAPKLVA